MKRTLKSALVVLVTMLVGCASTKAGERQQTQRAPHADGVEQRRVIRELLERASDAVNHREWDTLLAMSSNDVVWERRGSPSWKLEGREAIRAFLSKNDSVVEIVSFTIASARIEIVGDGRAVARSTMNELLRFIETDAVVQVVGTYEDEFVRRGSDGWLLVRRTIVPRFERNLSAVDASSIERLRPSRTGTDP